MFVVADRVKENVVIAGSGDVQLGGAVPGYQTFIAVMVLADTTWYAILDPTTFEWEVGVGTLVSGNKLRRASVLSSSSGGNKVNFAGNRCDIFQDVPASFVMNPVAAIPCPDGGNVSGTLHLDATTQRAFDFTITADITDFQIGTDVGDSVYVSVVIFLTQGAGGSHQVTWPSYFRWQGGFAPSLQTRAGATDVLQFVTRDGGVTWITAISLQAPPQVP